MGCADSSTLSSAPRSTGGYASLHTFTSARTRVRTLHAGTDTRAALYVCGTPACVVSFFSLPSRGSARLRLLHTRARSPHTHASTHRSAPSRTSLFLSFRVSPRESAAGVRALAVTLRSFVSACTSACTSAESEALTRSRAGRARTERHRRASSMTVPRGVGPPRHHDRARGRESAVPRCELDT